MKKKIIKITIMGMLLYSQALQANDYQLLADAVEFLIKQTKTQEKKIAELDSKIKILEDEKSQLRKKLGVFNKQSSCDCPEIKTLRADINTFKEKVKKLEQDSIKFNKHIKKKTEVIKVLPTIQKSKSNQQLNKIDQKIDEQNRRLQSYIDSRRNLDIPSVK